MKRERKRLGIAQKFSRQGGGVLVAQGVRGNKHGWGIYHTKFQSALLKHVRGVKASGDSKEDNGRHPDPGVEAQGQREVSGVANRHHGGVLEHWIRRGFRYSIHSAKKLVRERKECSSPRLPEGGVSIESKKK